MFTVAELECLRSHILLNYERVALGMLNSTDGQLNRLATNYLSLDLEGLLSRPSPDAYAQIDCL